MVAMEKNMPEFEELTETVIPDGLEEEEARDKAYSTILPKLRKDLQSIHLNLLLGHRTNEERPNSQTDYENERRLCK